MRNRRSHYQLTETRHGICSGICPRCGKAWALDPNRNCDCTRSGTDVIVTSLLFLAGAREFAPGDRSPLMAI